MDFLYKIALKLLLIDYWLLYFVTILWGYFTNTLHGEIGLKYLSNTMLDLLQSLPLHWILADYEIYLVAINANEIIICH